jgi:hypothetical protein
MNALLQSLRERNHDWSDPQSFHFAIPPEAAQLVVVREAFVTEAECQGLIEAYETRVTACIDPVRERSNVLPSPLLYVSALYRHQFLDEWRRAERVKLRIRDAVREAFAVDEAFFDGVVINRMQATHQHIEHADNADYTCKLHGDHRWKDGDCRDGTWIRMPSHWWRDFSAVLYLNEDFTGGSLDFPQHGISVRPRSGTLVMFPANRAYLHVVRPVIDGTRYAMPMWFTRDATRFIF